MKSKIILCLEIKLSLFHQRIKLFCKNYSLLIILFQILLPQLLYSGNNPPPSCVNCCCGDPVEVGIPCGDFQGPPMAPLTGWIDFSAGDTYCGWTVTSGTVSLHGPNHNNLGAGNPNGASQHMDLNGSSAGSISTNLNGLQIGYKYTIIVWYAKHNGTPTATCNIKVENGAWLDETWTATNTGSSLWLQKCFTFIALANSTTLEFIGTSPVPCCGMLIDDLTMYECANDVDPPVFSNTPTPLIDVDCVKDVPLAPILTATDLCDAQPIVTYVETKQGNPCHQTITRIWTVEDKCKNATSVEQIINVEDTEAPQISTLPMDIVISCDQDVLSEFYSWLNNNGGGIATDNCSKVIWSYTYNKEPSKHCEDISVTFSASDDCNNMVSSDALFSVVDIKAPDFTKLPQDVILNCYNFPYDSLVSWVNKNGNAVAKDNCGTVKWSNDFDGNLTKNSYTITFYATDDCNNVSTKEATFQINKSSINTYFNKKTCIAMLAGIDTLTFTKGNCDSLAITTTTYVKPDTIEISSYTCQKSNAINDTLKLTNQIGCDSIIIHKIDYIKPDTTINTIFKCGLPANYNDTIIYAGLYCDSMVINQFKKFPIDNINIQKTTCDSTKVGVLVLKFLNKYGCDSTVTISTILSSAIYNHLTKHLCGSGVNYQDSVKYATVECDSIVVTSYIYHALDTTYSSSSTCDINKAGEFSSTIKNIWGCDSTHILTVVLNPSDTTFLNSQTCDKQQVGTFKQLVMNKYGCDSLIISNISLALSDTTYISQNTCDPSKVGIFTTTFPDNPCDSVVITTRNLSQAYTFNFQKTTCALSQVGADTIKLTSIEGCDSILINNYKYVGISGSAESKDETCPGFKNGMVEIKNIINGNKPFQYSLDHLNWVFDSIFLSLKPDNYTLYVKDSQGCETEISGLLVKSAEMFTIDLGKDITVLEDQEVQLNLKYSALPVSVTWSPGSLINCNYCFTPAFTPTQNTEVFVSAINESGCTAEDSLNIKIRPQFNLYIPNAFSPDLDGINDKWIIYGNAHVLNIKELQIFDRWGANVFKAQNVLPGDTTKGWDGRHKGKLLNPAVFVFWAIVEYDNGQSELVKGEINLLR